MKTYRPRASGDYGDRSIDCQDALKEGFLELLERADASGWYRDEALCAILELVEKTVTEDMNRESMAQCTRDGHTPLH